MNIILSKKEKAELKLAHKKERDSLICDRIKVILALSDGHSASKVAEILLIDTSTVHRHLNDFLEKNKLNNKNGGSFCKLSLRQASYLKKHLEKNVYQKVSLIKNYIKLKYGIEYSVSGLTQWLNTNGFSYKKPTQYPSKLNLEKQTKFIKYYNRLKGQVESENIIFIDSCHPTMSTKIEYGWIKKGSSKSIKTTASRSRINLIGAICLKNLTNPIIKDYETINSDSICDFIKLLRDKHKNKGNIHIILDGAGYHKNNKVLNEAKKLKIKLHFLPPYSPNLNPIERLWKIMNENVRNNVFFNDKNVFRQSILYFFKNGIKNLKKVLETRITDKFQTYSVAT